MPLLDLWAKSPEQLHDKTVNQLIAFAGQGKLLDDSLCSKEFRAFLATVPPAYLGRCAEQCLGESFSDSGLALQDVVNEIGTRLGAQTLHGRYRGTKNHIGLDGLWRFPSGQAIVIEVKTTDAYRIDLNVIAEYRRKLIADGSITEKQSSILLIVGRQDTGDLEAQIRGSRHAWDVRIISVDALIRLMRIIEEVDDPALVQRIHNILIPHEFTRLDTIADVLFSATEEAKEEHGNGMPTVLSKQEVMDTPSESMNFPKATPVTFHDECITKVTKHLGIPLTKYSRSAYADPKKTTAVSCSLSKEYNPNDAPGYWFSVLFTQQSFLKQYASSYLLFACGTPDRLLLIPNQTFRKWLPHIGSDARKYFVLIDRKDNIYSLRLKTPIDDKKSVDVTHFLLPPSA